MLHSKNTTTDLILSSAHGFALLEESLFHTNKNPILIALYRFYTASKLAIIQHEVTGHGLTGQSFNRKIKRIDISPNPIPNPFSPLGYCETEGPKRYAYYLQENACSAISGMQSNQLLSQQNLDSNRWHGGAQTPLSLSSPIHRFFRIGL